MKKFLTVVFFLSLVGLWLDVACLDSNTTPSTGDYIAFLLIGIMLIAVALATAYGAGLTNIQEQEKILKGDVKNENNRRAN